MPMTENRPKWAMKVTQLRDFAKGRKLKIYKGGCYKLVFVDATDPIGEVLMRPFWMRYEKQNVWARFKFVDGHTGEDVWFAAPYYRCIESFCQMLEYDQVLRITRLPGVKLYVEEERDAILERMSKMKETEEWLADFSEKSKAKPEGSPKSRSRASRSRSAPVSSFT